MISLESRHLGYHILCVSAGAQVTQFNESRNDVCQLTFFSEFFIFGSSVSLRRFSGYSVTDGLVIEPQGFGSSPNTWKVAFSDRFDGHIDAGFF